MIPWNVAYQRLRENRDALMLFGRDLAKDEFTPQTRIRRFDSVNPALLSAAAATRNTGDAAATAANIATPTRNIVGSTPNEQLIDFPSGAVILGITSCAAVPQRTTAAFVYGPTGAPGNRDLFALDFRYVGEERIFAGNPIPEIIVDPDTPVNTAPPALADASSFGGDSGQVIPRELVVAPALGILIRVSSFLLPNAAPNQTPNMAVHVAFHCMVPVSPGQPN